jgi:uncharacterized membrane protein
MAFLNVMGSALLSISILAMGLIMALIVKRVAPNASDQITVVVLFLPISVVWMTAAAQGYSGFSQLACTEVDSSCVLEILGMTFVEAFAVAWFVTIPNFVFDLFG